MVNVAVMVNVPLGTVPAVSDKTQVVGVELMPQEEGDQALRPAKE
jgi:hypothetical protein